MLRISNAQKISYDAGLLVPDASVFEFARFYRREILPLVTDRDFASFYSDLGRSAVSPSLLLHVHLLAAIEGLSDRKAAHAVLVRLDWKVALGLSIDAAGFDPSRLSRFRARVLGRTRANEHEPASEEEKKGARLLFERLFGKLVDLGLVKRDQSVRLDSTHILSAAKNINRYQTIFESMRLVVRELDAIRPEFLDRPKHRALRERYTKSMGAYDLKKDRVRKNLEITSKDAIRLLRAIRKSGLAALKDLDAVAVLEKAMRDNVEIRRKGSKRRKGRPSKKDREGNQSSIDLLALGEEGQPSESEVEIVDRQSGDRMITPHDCSARLGVKKSGKLRWTGRKLHATETVPELPGQASFIVDGETTPGNRPDIDQTLPTLKRLDQRGLKPGKLYVDSGYVSGETVALAESEHGVELQGPPAQPADRKKLPVEQFSVDFEAAEAQCPAGKASDRFKLKHDGARFVGATARFNVATCSGCELASQCLGAKTFRTVTFTAYHHTLVAQRQKARTPEFKKDYKKRMPCEGIFASLSRDLRQRRSRLKGDLKTYFEHMLGLATINVMRLSRVILSQPILVPMRV